ncbi:FAD-binding domain-containing protein [Penicillium malachiteum]|nr:FAD-binding domain-containing protein [Penicillium malachiteum]
MTSPIQFLMQASLEKLLIIPFHPDYHALQGASWSTSTQLNPAAIISLRSALNVSTTLQTLIKTGLRLSIRGGGHAQYPGVNDIDGDGVNIDLGLLNWTRYDPTTETVEIGPRALWKGVYGSLQERGHIVAGSRDGNKVGVSFKWS